MALAAWVPDYFRLPKTGNATRLEALADDGRLQRVEIEGLPGPAYLHPAAVSVDQVNLPPCSPPSTRSCGIANVSKTCSASITPSNVYTPAPRRRFGYFTLPILHHGALVGRLDPKAHRAAGQFEVKALALEPGVEPSDDLVAGLASALRRLAAWHGTPELVIRRSEPADLADRLLS